MKTITIRVYGDTLGGDATQEHAEKFVELVKQAVALEWPNATILSESNMNLVGATAPSRVDSDGDTYEDAQDDQADTESLQAIEERIFKEGQWAT